MFKMSPDVDGIPSETPNGHNDSRPLGRARPISVAVDPVALVITECITITSAMRKDARWRHSSVSAILGGGSNKPAPAPILVKDKRDRSERRSVAESEDVLASRWGLRGKKGKSMQDNPLMAAFTRLRSDLKGYTDTRQFDTPALLQPFLLVIRSSSTSAPITSLALIAITKFLSYNVIGRDSPRLPMAMQLLSSAITHCRFEATDSAADEIVLLRILKLMESMIAGPGGDLLGDESVCEMMETGISMCCQHRLSDLLRRSAEIAMVSMCQVIFERLKYLEIEAGDEPGALEESTKNDMDAVKMEPSVNANEDSPAKVKEADDSTQNSANQAQVDAKGRSSVTTGSSQEDASQGSESEDETPIKPYSLPSIRELFRVLVDLLDPHERQHTDTMRVMALRIVDVALEVAGPSIASHPSLANLAKDTLCRHLFQLVRSENMAILNESLRVAGTLLATCRSVLKLQQELFLSYLVACLHPRVEIPQEPGIDPVLYEGVPQAPRLVKPAPSQTNSGRSTPVPVKDRQKLGLEGGSRKPDARETMVESIGALVRMPSFMVELFVNYDCEIDRSDLCVDMVGLLSRNAFPDSATWSTTNVAPLCLDALLGHVQSIAERSEEPASTEGYPDVERLREQRARKKIIVRGAAKFNESPRAGIAFLASQGIIKDENDPESIARFIKGTTRVDKKILGDYISKKDNGPILSAFLELFDFTDQRVDEALRQLLNTFRLPGESQLIERIVTEFSEKYCANATPEGIADKDAVYVLTYAIIMLNTDQHNPNVKAQNRMSFVDFSRNLRGVNGGKDFSPDYLQIIYDSIKTREIILPEEHDNKHAYEHAWSELLIKVQSASELVICKTNVFDADMFRATWKPIVATLAYVFMSASDDTVFSRVVTGFDQCAQIAATYAISDALDHIIFCLSFISTLASETPPNTSLNTEVQAGEKRVMVSETAVKFGRDFKAQLATVVLFRLLSGHEAVVRSGWDHVVRILLNLFVNSLIPSSVLKTPEELGFPPIPLQDSAHLVDRSERAAESGLFSALSHYVSSFASDEPPEPSDSEIESTLCTIDCVTACTLEDIFVGIRDMPVSSIKALLKSLLAQLPESTSPRVIAVKPEIPAPTALRPNGSKARITTPAYDPAILFILELATSLALRDNDTIEALGKDVADVLDDYIRDASHTHPLILSRVVYYLLTLLRASHDYDFIRSPVVLHSFSAFDQDLLKQVAFPLLTGLSSCIKWPSSLRSEMANSPDFWSILRVIGSLPEAAQGVFDVLEELVDTKPSGITADNYEPFIIVLNDFATAGSIGAVQEQQREQAARKGKPVKQKPQTNEVVVRGTKAVSMVYNQTFRAPYFIEHSQLEATEAWNVYWSPIFRALTTQCLNPCREIRHQAFSSLQRALLSQDLASPEHNEWTAIFGEVLFPLITQLLKPEIYQSDPLGMGETRVQAATLLCKIFLHYLVLLSEWAGMRDLWFHILGIMDRLMNSGQGDILEEAVSENLKNILLVMSTSGYLTPPSQNPKHEELWFETWKRLDRFLPNLFAEIFPGETKRIPSGRNSLQDARRGDPAEPPGVNNTATPDEAKQKS